MARFIGRFVILTEIILLSATVLFADTYNSRRSQMVERDLKARDINDADVLKAMSEVERHLFVPEAVKKYAYADRPLPIGYSQTISQPYVVALMTQLLDAEPGMKALEIGTGSGYQAAVLHRTGLEVFSIEIIPELFERTRQIFDEQDLPIHVKNADGYYGWKENAPFDRIIITAAANHVPQPLLDQLKPGGRMVLPLGKTNLFQTLTVIDKDADGRVSFFYHIGVRFVPMTGKMLE